MSSPLRPASPVDPVGLVNHVPHSLPLPQMPSPMRLENAGLANVDAQMQAAEKPADNRSWCRFVLDILQNAMIFFIDNAFNVLEKPCQFIFFASDYINALARDVAVVAGRCLFAPEFNPYSPKFTEQLQELTTQAEVFKVQLHDLQALLPISTVNLKQTLNRLIQLHGELKASTERIQRYSNSTRRCNDLAELHTSTVAPLLENFQRMRASFSDLIRNEIQEPAVNRFDYIIRKLWEFGAKVPKAFTSDFRDLFWTLDRAFDTGLFNDARWESHGKDNILQNINALETGPDVTVSADQNAPPSLTNLGNSCYMNALTQMIFAVPDLAQRLANPLARLPRESDQAYERRENIRKELYYFTQPRANQPTTVPTLSPMQILFLIAENDRSTVTLLGDPTASGQSRIPSVNALQRSFFEPKWRYDLRMHPITKYFRDIKLALDLDTDSRAFAELPVDLQRLRRQGSEGYARLVEMRDNEQRRLNGVPEYIRIQGLIENGVDYGEFVYENIISRKQLDSAQVLELYMDAVLPSYRFEQEVAMRTDMFPGLEFVQRPEVHTVQQLDIKKPEDLPRWLARVYPGVVEREVPRQIRREHDEYVREAQQQMSPLDYQIRSFFQERVEEGEGRNFDPNATMEADNVEVRDVGPEAGASRQLPPFSSAENIHRLQGEPELFRYTTKRTYRNLPDVLPLHLKRFESVLGGSVLQKINFGVTLPQDGYVDLTEYQNSADRDQPAVYRIASYVEHRGGLNGGHYVAYVERNGHYYYCNDTQVREVSRNEFINNRNAYTIMLKRVPADEAADVQARRLAATID